MKLQTHKQSQYCRKVYSEYTTAANIVCYQNLANKERITMLLQVAINKTEERNTKTADYHTDVNLSC